MLIPLKQSDDLCISSNADHFAPYRLNIDSIRSLLCVNTYGRGGSKQEGQLPQIWPAKCESLAEQTGIALRTSSGTSNPRSYAKVLHVRQLDLLVQVVPTY